MASLLCESLPQSSLRAPLLPVIEAVTLTSCCCVRFRASSAVAYLSSATAFLHFLLQRQHTFPPFTRATKHANTCASLAVSVNSYTIPHSIAQLGVENLARGILLAPRVLGQCCGQSSIAAAYENSTARWNTQFREWKNVQWSATELTPGL